MKLKGWVCNEWIHIHHSWCWNVDWLEVKPIISREYIIHLLPDCCIPRTPLMLNCLPIHPHLDAPSQSTPPALITMGLVYYTPSVISTLTRIVPATSYGSLEEPSTSITSKYTIVLSRGEVTAHTTWNII